MTSPSNALERELRSTIRDVPDFPTKGIVFKDITPVLAQAALFARTIAALAAPYASKGITHVVGIESRGFILGSPIAHSLGAAFVPVRKRGKLPWRTLSVTYALEYGSDTVEVHVDAFGSGAHALVVDDVLATGGTAQATCSLVERAGARVSGCAFLLALGFLPGLTLLAEREPTVLVRY